jgi:hypothetical protein
VNAIRFRKKLNTTFLWNCHLGHIKKKRMQKLRRDLLLESSDSELFNACEACRKGKMAKKLFTGYVERAIASMKIIHSDVCCPMSLPASSGYFYFVNFSCHLSMFGYIYLMKQKSENSKRS